MYIKLDYSNFSAFDLDVKAIEILKYIIHFSGEKRGKGWGTKYQALRKYLFGKLFFRLFFVVFMFETPGLVIWCALLHNNKSKVIWYSINAIQILTGPKRKKRKKEITNFLTKRKITSALFVKRAGNNS